MTEERELIAKIKANTIDSENCLRKLCNIQNEADRPKAASAVWKALIDLMKWHGKQTDALYEHFPEHASEIQTRGPGGGR